MFNQMKFDIWNEFIHTASKMYELLSVNLSRDTRQLQAIAELNSSLFAHENQTWIPRIWFGE